MLMVTKVVVVGATALAMGGVPAPGSDPANTSVSASPVVAAVNTSQASPACPSGCNVWRMIYDGR
ncbi:hypothetical protein [Variovorax paradoxus]|jgi:hypothetical protein|uniref:Uncharacterized protein n=1 Tax=Variovorax paradoxus TaxID=34073 RepID=A0A679JBR3_VARPD|nr:hypothetical protein VVAX_03609 [Variovorax paradoxus]